jgi:CheY-like chemotaxis protein
VLSANGLATALRAYDALEPDLGVTELGLPPEPRYGVLDAIRARAELRGRHVRVVAYTSFAGERERQSCLEHGFDAYFAKPMGLELLLEELASLVSGRRSNPALRDSPPPS